MAGPKFTTALHDPATDEEFAALQENLFGMNSLTVPMDIPVNLEPVMESPREQL